MVNIIGRSIPVQPQQSGVGSLFETLAAPFMDMNSGEMKRSAASLNAAKTAEVQRALDAGAVLADLARSGNLNSRDADAAGILAGKPSTFAGGYVKSDTLRSGAPLQGDAVARSSLAAGDNYGSTGMAFGQNQANELEKQRLAEATRIKLAENELKPVVGPDNRITYARQSAAAGAAYPASVDQTRAVEIGKVLPTATPEEQKRFALGNAPNPPPLYTAVLPDGSPRTTYDGKTDVNGNVLPQGTTIVRIQGTAAETGVRPGVQAAAQKAEISARKANEMIAYTRQLANNPMNVGISGWVKETAQDAAAIASNLASGLGYTGAQDAITDMQTAASRNPAVQSALPGLFQFDPNLPKLQTSYDMLVFSLAAAIAGQEGRDISNADLVMSKRAFGDPRSLFATPENLNARLDSAQDLLDISRRANQSALGGGAPMPNGPARPPPVTSTPVRPPGAPAPQPAPTVSTDPIQRARDAIARGASREQVIQRLRANGINPEGQL